MTMVGPWQTRRRLSKLREEGLVDRVTLPQAGRTRCWFATQYGAQIIAEWPELRNWRPTRTMSDRTAARLRVRDAIPRSDPASIAAACAIGRDRAFTQVNELAAITVPTLVIPGADTRHPAALAAQAARTLPRGHLADVSLSAGLADALAPALWDFLTTHLTLHAAAPGRPGSG
ncbi:hypothetical protein [Streptomyces sp. NPDC005009]